MATETNDGGNMKAIGSAIIPGANGDVIAVNAFGVRSAITAAAGELILELVEAIAVTEFHAVATYAATNDDPASTPIVVKWIDATHAKIVAPGVSEGAPCVVYFTIRRIAATPIAATNNIPLPPA
jgi:hypothetical protein